MTAGCGRAAGALPAPEQKRPAATVARGRLTRGFLVTEIVRVAERLGVTAVLVQQYGVSGVAGPNSSYSGR